MLPGWPVEAGAAVVRLRRERPRVCLTLLPVPPGLSPRLAAIVNALPLAPHSRVLEIGCGPGAAARALATRLVTGHILAIDRSASAIAQARAAAAEQIAAGRLSVRQVAVEDFVLEADEEPYDIVFAVRVGALDGRYRQAGERALQRIAKATTPGARLFIDGGDPLRELPIPDA
jgi:cyclopropane fatty-acyl-phospholipid synthase-like methyltransferase